MKTFKNTAEISVKNAREEENGTISFAEPLAITDDSRQWNNTRYDIDSLDINQYDGTVTADHGQKLSDVIGKVTNLRKDGNKVLIDGIKFAVKENPLAVLAKNLMKGGFVTGVSIETIGEDPDETLTWKNHSLCGLSVVAHPNNKHAYAVVSNSIAEARINGLETAELEEIGDQFGERMNYVSNSLDSILSRYQQNSRSSKLDDILVALNGGKGSGHFGHSGRPGEVGGSAPSGSGGGGGGSLATKYKEYRNSPKVKKAFDEYFDKGAEEYVYEGKWKSLSIEDTLMHSLYDTFDAHIYERDGEKGPRAKAFEKLQRDLDVELQMPKTVYNIMMKSMHKSAGRDSWTGEKKYKTITEEDMEKRRATCHEKLSREFKNENEKIESYLGKERSWGWRGPHNHGDWHKGTKEDIANEKKLIERDHLFTKTLVDIYYDAVADNYYHNPVE